MNNRISVIVPVYKVEAYLEKCVKSILAQTYQDLEIILVDDGSPDNCPELCDELAKTDNRVVVIHKENGGLSSARNAGIDIATGDYIGFVDSDDFIHPQMYEKMYEALLAADADICICNHEKVNEAGEVIVHKPGPVKNEVLTKEQAYRKLFEEYNWYFVTAPMKLYKKALFSSLRFEEGRLHEDEFLVHRLFGECHCIATVADKLYMYVERDTSIMHTRAVDSYLSAVDAFVDRYGYFDRLRLREFANKSLIAAYAQMAVLMRTLRSREYKETIYKKAKKLSSLFFKYANLRCIIIWYRYCKYVYQSRS